MKQAWKAFFKYKDLLCEKSAPMKDRLQILGLVTASSLFWCSGSWNLTSVQLAKLRGMQQKMIRWMLHIRRRSSESLDLYMTRCARTVKGIRMRHGIEGWDESFHRSVFSWGGHLARMRTYDPDRASHQVFLYKNWQWIKRQSDDRGNQHHGRRLHVWRWERPLYKFFLPEPWEQQALNKQSWNSKLDEMVAWRVQNR